MCIRDRVYTARMTFFCFIVLDSFVKNQTGNFFERDSVEISENSKWRAHSSISWHSYGSEWVFPPLSEIRCWYVTKKYGNLHLLITILWLIYGVQQLANVPQNNKVHRTSYLLIFPMFLLFYLKTSMNTDLNRNSIVESIWY